MDANNSGELHSQYYGFFFIIIWLTSTFLLRSFLKKRVKSTKPHLHLPPSPPSLPIIGHLHLLSPTLHQSFYNISNQYGPLLYLKLGSSHCLLVSSSSMAAEIFKTHDLAFSSRPKFAFSDELPYGSYGFITAPYGDYWRFMKKLCVTELLSTRQLERSRAIRKQELQRFVEKFVRSGCEGEVVDLGGEIMKLTNNVTCRMVMSTRCSTEGGDAEKCRELVKESFELAVKMCFGDVLGPLKKLGYWVYGKKALDVSRRYDELFERILKEHEERESTGGSDDEREDKDFMDILLEVLRDDKAEVKITRTHIKAFLLDLFIAGTDTSAEAMQWAIAELINHPDIFQKVREEIYSVVGKTKLVEESDIPNLPYLHSVVKETLRLYPPGPVTTRESRQSCTIGGFDVPEKTAVAINLYAIMRDPCLWDDPNEFRPERFMVYSKEQNISDNSQSEVKGHSFNFVPFGAGRRGCPGTNLAFSLMNTTIAAMVQCFNWKVFGRGGERANVDMQVGTGMSMCMAHPLKCLPIVHFNPFGSSI